jgi:hypothetical protein
MPLVGGPNYDTPDAGYGGGLNFLGGVAGVGEVGGGRIGGSSGGLIGFFGALGAALGAVFEAIVGVVVAALKAIAAIVFADMLEFFGHVFGHGYGITKGFVEVGWGIAIADWSLAKRGAIDIGKAIAMPRSGSHSGWNWPGTRENVGLISESGTKLNNASIGHDRSADLVSSSALLGWVHEAWFGSGLELGPWGQAYRLAGTVAFGGAGLVQKALGN